MLKSQDSCCHQFLFSALAGPRLKNRQLLPPRPTPVQVEEPFLCSVSVPQHPDPNTHFSKVHLVTAAFHNR